MRVVLKAYNLKLGLAICRELDRNHEGDFLALVRNTQNGSWQSQENLEVLGNAARAMAENEQDTVRPLITSIYASTSLIKTFLRNEWTRIFATEPPDEQC